MRVVVTEESLGMESRRTVLSSAQQDALNAKKVRLVLNYPLRTALPASPRGE